MSGLESIDCGREGSYTICNFVKCAGNNHVLHDHHLEFAMAILFVKKLLQPAALGSISHCASNFVAYLEKLVDDMAGYVSVCACHEDPGAGSDDGRFALEVERHCQGSVKGIGLGGFSSM